MMKNRPVTENWQSELAAHQQKNFKFLVVYCIAVNTLLSATFFFQKNLGDIAEFNYRIIAIAVLGLGYFFIDKSKLSPCSKLSFPILTMVLLEGMILVDAPADLIGVHSLLQLFTFIGAALFVIWPLKQSIVFWSAALTVQWLALALFSVHGLDDHLMSGGYLRLGAVFLTVVFIQIRYSGLKSLFEIRKEIFQNNEWMEIQNEIIRSKSIDLQRSNQRLKEFANIVSHDLKAPLRGINNIVGWLHEDCAATLTEDSRSHLQLLQKQVVKMEQLIKGMLDYSKAASAKAGAEWIDLDELVTELVESLGTDGKTEFRLKLGVARMLGTRVVVRQVLQNLVTNAIKHNNKPVGTLEIEIRDSGDMIHFSITDDGPGIEPSKATAIFEMYHAATSSDGYTNTGIGLPLAKKLIDESGGRIWLDNTITTGSKFCFTLPVRMS